MRSLSLVAVLVTTLLGAYYLSAQEADTSRPIEAEIRELMKQRLEVLQQVVDSTNSQYESGVVTIDALYDAHAELTAAELEMTNDPIKRNEIHQRHVDWLAKKEAYLLRLHANGMPGGEDYLQAKAERLRAEIDMLRDTGSLGSSRTNR